MSKLRLENKKHKVKKRNDDQKIDFGSKTLKMDSGKKRM